MRLIDADACIKAINDKYDAVHETRRRGASYPSIAWDSGMSSALSIVESQPTIDAEPVRHGKWIEYPTADGMNQCSECGILRFGDSNYCPNCGAKMDAK